MTRGPPFIVMLWKENENLQKPATVQKSQIFYENWLYQRKDQLRTKTPIWEANFSSKDEGYDLYEEMPSYKLTEIILANLWNASL